MDIKKIYEVVSGFNQFMCEEIGDQDGFYDGDLWKFIEKYHDHKVGTCRQPENFDWIGEAKSALLHAKTKINADDHPLGPLKMKHKINLNFRYGQVMVELKKLKYPGWKPLLERV